MARNEKNIFIYTYIPNPAVSEKTLVKATQEGNRPYIEVLKIEYACLAVPWVPVNQTPF